MHPGGKWKFSTMDRGVAYVRVTLISMQRLWCAGHCNSGVSYIFNVMSLWLRDSTFVYKYIYSSLFLSFSFLTHQASEEIYIWKVTCIKAFEYNLLHNIYYTKINVWLLTYFFNGTLNESLCISYRYATRNKSLAGYSINFLRPMLHWLATYVTILYNICL